MPAVSQSSQYVEGADLTRRFAVNGDATTYPTGGYDLLALIRAIPAYSASAFKRVVNVRHRTLASQLLCNAVVTNTFSGGQISAMKLILTTPSNSGELANATSTANLALEIIFEGY